MFLPENLNEIHRVSFKIGRIRQIMADATGWVGACILVRACALPPELANGDLPISVRSASLFFCLGIVFPSQYRPGGTGRIRNGFYRSKNSYLIHHSIVFSAWQLVFKSVIQVNR